MERDEGLLLIQAKAPAGRTVSFNEWYDEDHVPPRLAVPGITGARRYRELDGVEPDSLAAVPALPDEFPAGPEYDPGTFLTYYNLANLQVLEGESYRGLGATATDRERELQKLSWFDRRVYRAVPSPGDQAGAGEYLVCNWWTPATGQDEADLGWLDTEYLPRAAELPGWRGARRFRLESGAGPRYLAMYDLDSLDAFTDGSHAAVLAAAGGTSVVGGRALSVLRSYHLHRGFDRAATA